MPIDNNGFFDQVNAERRLRQRKKQAIARRKELNQALGFSTSTDLPLEQLEELNQHDEDLLKQARRYES